MRSHPSSSISEVKTGKEKRGKMKMRKEISPQLKNRKREDKIKIVKEISPQLARQILLRADFAALLPR